MPKGSRGCGDRQDGGLYITVGLGNFGLPLEEFIVDPVVAWQGARTLRAPMIIADAKGINHLVMGIGKQFYPFVSDFIEETRRLGVSKRVSSDFDLSPLTLGKSRLLLMHPKAIPEFKYMTEAKCPKGKKEAHQCIGDLWALSSLESVEEKHEITFDFEKENLVEITTPSAKYRVDKPQTAEKPYVYSSGIIMMFPFFRFEYVSKRKKMPDELKQKFAKAGFQLECVEK